MSNDKKLPTLKGLNLPWDEQELWTLVQLLGAAQSTFEYLSRTAVEQGDKETADTLDARAKLALIFSAGFANILTTQVSKEPKH